MALCNIFVKGYDKYDFIYLIFFHFNVFSHGVHKLDVVASPSYSCKAKEPEPDLC